MSDSKRYSDADLAVFQELIERKLEKTMSEMHQLQAQLGEVNEHFDERSDWLDDSSNQSESEMLVKMMNRQKKYANDLKLALIRIKNKSYGICQLSGNLIDKRRLMAVPTTSKSFAAKNASQAPKKKIKVPYHEITRGSKLSQMSSKKKEKVKGGPKNPKTFEDEEIDPDELFEEENSNRFSSLEDIEKNLQIDKDSD